MWTCSAVTSTPDREVDQMNSDSDSDSDSDSMPDVSQLMESDRHRRQGRESTSAAADTIVEPKAEDEDQTLLDDSAGVETSTSKSSRHPSKQPAVPRKRALDSDEIEVVGESIHASASQPPPRSSKRTRPSLPPPPATQPPPATPISTSKPAPQSSTKKKGPHRNGTTLRKRSANFWHLDGSVVIQVQNTLFRLHRSRLAQQSEFFAGLFRNSDGRDSPALVEEDTVDNCPVYVISGVSVLDFERLLTALDAGIAYAINPPPFNVVASLIRAAHALSFKAIVAFATHLLHQMWPSDLDKLCRPEERAAAAATQTILLAQDCELPELLRPAYYELLCTPGFGQDLSVYLHAESSGVPDSAARLKAESDEDEKNAPPPTLPASDFVRLANAKQTLQREWQALVRAPPLPSAFVCPLANAVTARTHDAALLCRRAWLAEEAQWYSWIVPTGVFELGMADVFAGMKRLIDIDWHGKGFCVGCVSERRDAWATKRRALWEKLDVLLGLKGEDGH
ncbi:hypothetical protein PYCCODRAFT_1212386 [Trametes coccinea BRFM310]|uniref:BTB domain-containing protein n=1 Tax=Trametes coccinea (strain BRFM310) TaxID=1353009 RepID=A0A1Y2I6Z7_TRAC3|nr:hypothetical protein PYCCODRAFT_1212386 [Trametes coccinea BRFM310]